MPELLVINPDLDRASLARQFSTFGFVQIQNVLTDESAERLRSVLLHSSQWELVSQVGKHTPPKSSRTALQSESSESELSRIKDQIRHARDPIEYAFMYFSYPLVTAYLEKWQPGSSYERLLEELNSADFLGLLREICGEEDIVKADGQATLYAPGHFLWPHTDAESSRGRKVAYVLNLTSADWRPEWGGYLNFYDSDWNVEKAFRPAFNTLNLFSVPRWHNVAEVASNAPLARYAVTGWGRAQVPAA